MYCHIEHNVIATPRLSVSEKIVQLQTMLDQFPDANPDMVKDRILRELKVDIDRLKQSVQGALDPKSPTLRPFADSYMRQLQSRLDLYDTLLGTVPPRQAEDFMRANE